MKSIITDLKFQGRKLMSLIREREKYYIQQSSQWKASEEAYRYQIGTRVFIMAHEVITMGIIKLEGFYNS